LDSIIYIVVADGEEEEWESRLLLMCSRSLHLSRVPARTTTRWIKNSFGPERGRSVNPRNKPRRRRKKKSNDKTLTRKILTAVAICVSSKLNRTLRIYPSSSQACSTSRFLHCSFQTLTGRQTPNLVVCRSTLGSTRRISPKYFLYGISVPIRTIIWTRPIQTFMSLSRLPYLRQRKSGPMDYIR
jgi:hypothetical protein